MLSLIESTSCLDCPTPPSVPTNDKNRCIGVVPVITPPVITQSFARETVLNKPDILVGDLVDLAGSSPSVAQIKNLRSVTQTMTDPSIKTSLMNDDKFTTVPESLEASCSIPAKFVANGPRTGVMVTSPNVQLQGREVTEIQAEKCNDKIKQPDKISKIICLPCSELNTF